MASLRPMDHHLLDRQVSLIKPGTVDINDKEIFNIVTGHMDKDNLPPITSRLVKVFISSTFSDTGAYSIDTCADMIKERDFLMEHAYPELKEFSRQRYGLEFQMMDLRWGIQDHSRIDHTTLDFCLQEIDNCRNYSVGPSFVLFLGQKYGYRPIPSTIEDKEFEAIRRALECAKHKDIALLDVWFKKDTNRIPAYYQLQPISSVLKNIDNQLDKELKERDEAEWNRIFVALQQMLRQGARLAVEIAADSVSDVEKYYISVTECEINRGLFEHPTPQTHCLVFQRTITNLHDCLMYERASRFIDMSPDKRGVPDREAERKQQRMKDQKLNLLVAAARFDLTWDQPDVRDPNDNDEYLRSFCTSFVSNMKSAIIQTAGNAASAASDWNVREIVQHLVMCRTRCDTFLGREAEIASVRDGVLRACPQALVVHGSSGTGKTSFMAKVTSLVASWFPSSCQPVVMVRFLGTTARSSSIRLVLGSLCWQIATAYDCDVQQIPSDYTILVKHFHELLRTISTELKPLVILLDSLDQLSPSHQAHGLLWLPRTLPPNVHLVVSTLPDEYDLLKTLREAVAEPSHFVEIKPLGQSVGLDVLRSWMTEAKRTVTDEQMKVIKAALAECSLPLYMKLIFDKVCQWRSYTPAEETVIEPTVKGIILSLFDRIEKYYGRVFVKHVLSYMTASKYGLSDVEMEDLLSLDDAVLNDEFKFWNPPVRRIPPVLLPRLYNELRPYITLREANGHIVYYWYHRQFIDAVTQRYLVQLQHRQYIHSILADYFLGKWGGGTKKPYYFTPGLKAMLGRKEKFEHADRKVPLQPLVFGGGTSSSPLPGAGFGGGGFRHRGGSGANGAVRYNLRKLSELPHHLLESKRFAELRDEVLFNYHWIYTKLKATSLQDVLSDFRSAVEAGVNDRATQTVLGALRVGGHVLASNPETLAFELLARLVSYYDQCKYVARLLQQCDLDSTEQSALLPMYQCYEAPRGMLMYILDHGTAVIDVLFSTSSNELICACADRSIGFWDLATGERTHATTIPPVEDGMSLVNMKLYLSADGRRLACDPGSNGSPVFIYEVKTGLLLHTVGQKSPLVKRTFQAGDLLCRQKTIIDMRTGRIVADLDELISSKKFVVCNITPNEQFIIFGESDKINVFNMARRECIAKVNCAHPPSVIAITRDSTRAFVGFTSSCLLKVYDVDSRSTSIGRLIKEFNYLAAFPHLATEQGNKYYQEIAEIALLPTRSDLALLNIKRTILIVVHVSEGSTAAPPPVLLDTSNKEIQADNASLFDITLVVDNMHVYAVARCGDLLCIWNAARGQMITFLRPHSAGKLALAVSGANFSKPLVAASSFIQAAVKVWDLSKTQDQEPHPLTVYECHVNQVAAAPDKRLLFVRKSKSLGRSDGYKLLDHFGIDVWNLSTGQAHTCLPFHQYGKLLQMEVSRNGHYLGLLLNPRDEYYLAVLGLRPDLVPYKRLPHWAAKSFTPSPDWRYVVTYAQEENESSVKLWETRSGTELLRLKHAHNAVFTFDGISMLTLQEGKIVVVRLSAMPEVGASFACDAVGLKPIPAHNRWVLATMPTSASGFASVTIWDFTLAVPVLTVNNLHYEGICDFSKDGRLMIDAFLQVFSVETGQLVYGLTQKNRDLDPSFVRLTHDGLYAIAVDSATITVYRIRDGRVMAHTSTHGKAVSLELFDYGYLQAIGREDGYVSITKLVTGRFADKIDSVYERTRQLLRSSTVSSETIASFDMHFRHAIDEVDLTELPSIKSDIYSQMTMRANIPMVISVRPRVSSQTSLNDLADGPSSPNGRKTQPRLQTSLEETTAERRRRSSPFGQLYKFFRRSKDYNVSPDASVSDMPHARKESKSAAKAKTLGRSKDLQTKCKSSSMHDIYTPRVLANVGTMVLSVTDMAARSQATAPARTSPAKKSAASRALITELFPAAATAVAPAANGSAKDTSINAANGIQQQAHL